MANSVWQFGNLVRQFSLAKRIRFDNLAIRFGNSIRQFDLAFVCGCLSSW
jgi:hypothetical protein